MNWKTLIAELQSFGMTQVEIGLVIDKSQPWVADIVSGRYGDLKYADGVALKRLHAKKSRQFKKAA